MKHKLVFWVSRSIILMFGFASGQATAQVYPSTGGPYQDLLSMGNRSADPTAEEPVGSIRLVSLSETTILPIHLFDYCANSLNRKAGTNTTGWNPVVEFGIIDNDGELELRDLPEVLESAIRLEFCVEEIGRARVFPESLGSVGSWFRFWDPLRLKNDAASGIIPDITPRYVQQTRNNILSVPFPKIIHQENLTLTMAKWEIDANELEWENYRQPEVGSCLDQVLGFSKVTSVNANLRYLIAQKVGLGS